LDQHSKVRHLAIYGTDITEDKQAREALRQREAALESRKNELEEVNTALRVLLKQREGDKAKLEERVLLNVKRRVLPHVEKLKRSGLHAQQMACLTLLESNLNDLASPFSLNLSSKYLQLTPSEMEIAHFVKDGQSTKDIADTLNLSTRTVEFHRANIRKKLGIKNVRTSLRSHLQSLE
jgi:DNA-binding CsgD family transcriptional regulator